jgi:hypothetical protein
MDMEGIKAKLKFDKIFEGGLETFGGNRKIFPGIGRHAQPRNFYKFAKNEEKFPVQYLILQDCN